jgi:hypothetical protein
VVEELFLLEAHKNGQHVDGDGDGDGHGDGGGDGEGHGDGGGDGEGERGGRVDKLPRAAHENNTCEGHDVDGEISMSRNHGRPRVKARADHIVTLSKKRTSIEYAFESGQPSIQATSTRKGILFDLY